LPTVIAPVPSARPIVNVPAAPVDGMMVGIAREVPVAFWKFRNVIVEVVPVAELNEKLERTVLVVIVIAPFENCIKGVPVTDAVLL